MVLKLFVTCSQGLEALLVEELKELGLVQLREGFRGVHVEAFDDAALYKINYCSRLGSRVLLPLNDFVCFDEKSLYKGASKIDWEQYVPPGKTIAIDANVNHKKIRNSLFAAQVVKDAICDQLKEKRGTRPNVDVKNPDIQLNLFIHQDRAILSFDTSGVPLSKRGYRQEAVEAPLQETLAAAILRLAGYTGTEVLYDPCCGSGTILIEAALIAAKIAPGYLRREWGFMHLPFFKNEDWLKIKAEVDALRISLVKGKLFGSDIAKNAIRASRINFKASGFAQVIEVKEGDLRDLEPETLPNLVITNPPYGLRMNEDVHLDKLYRALGDFMKRKTAKPAKGFVFTGNLDLTKEVGLAAKRRYVMNNSGIESRLLEFDLY